MTCEPLKEYLAEKSINFPLINTACWRGYIGSWEIKDNKLYLISLDDFSDEGISLHHIFLTILKHLIILNNSVVKSLL